MLYGLLLAIMILDGIVLGIVILLQAGKGGGLAAVGGGAAATDGVLAGRQATTLLTRTTWTTGSVFLALAFVLSIMSSRASTPASLTRGELQTTVPQPVLDGGGAGGAGAIGILPAGEGGAEAGGGATGGDAGGGGAPPAGGGDPGSGGGAPEGAGG